MNRVDVTSNARLAGQVERYHTWPVHRRQSVGEHTWQVFRLYWQIFGPMTSAVSTYILWHDAGELVTGDPPFPVKAQNPTLKAEYDQLETSALARMGGPDGPTLLTDVERAQCKVADLLDMWEFGLSELAMGNRYAQPIIDDTLKAAYSLAKDQLSRDECIRIDAYVSGVKARCRETGL